MNVVAIGLIIAGIALTIVGGIKWHNQEPVVDYVLYQGEEVFNTQQEYAMFKEALTEPAVESWTVNEISASPPASAMPLVSAAAAAF